MNLENLLIFQGVDMILLLMGFSKPFQMTNYFVLIWQQTIAVNVLLKKAVFSNEYSSPVCTIQSADIVSGKNNLIFAFSEIFSSTLKFCNKYNKKPASYYSQEEHMKTGEKA